MRGGGLEPCPKVSRTRAFAGDLTAGEGQLPLGSFLKMTGSQKGCGEGKSSFSFCGREAGREATSSPPALRLSSCESAEDRPAFSSPSLLPPCLPVPTRPQLGAPRQLEVTSPLSQFGGPEPSPRVFPKLPDLIRWPRMACLFPLWRDCSPRSKGPSSSSVCILASGSLSPPGCGLSAFVWGCG